MRQLPGGRHKNCRLAHVLNPLHGHRLDERLHLAALDGVRRASALWVGQVVLELAMPHYVGDLTGSGRLGSREKSCKTE